jgi:DNA-binding transcriptional MocR family regulator
MDLQYPEGDEVDSIDAASLSDRIGNWSQGRGPLHQRLTIALSDAIRQGLLPPQTRLPAERAFAQALALSRTTIVAAYNTLREEGWLESRPGSGTWVSPGRAQAARLRARASAVNDSPLMNLLTIDDNENVDLAMGTPQPLSELPADLFAVSPALQQAFLSERNYMPQGYAPLRETIARHYSRHGVPTDADQILVTSGAQQAVHLVVSLFVQRGDPVLLENPTYFGALDSYRLAGARLIPLDVGERHIDTASLRERVLAARPPLIHLTPTFNNPTGAVMPAEQRIEVASIAREAGVIVVEDGTLSELSIDGHKVPAPIAAHAPEDTVLTIGSMSKLYWGGLRIGWLRGPVALIRQLTRLKSASDLGCPVMTQAVATQLLSVVDRARAIRREQLASRRDVLTSTLAELLPEWRFRQPAGGLFVWASVPDVDTRYFAQTAIRHRVAVTPGALFSINDSHDHALRIQFLPDDPLLRLGVARRAAAWREHRGTGAERYFQSRAIV